MTAAILLMAAAGMPVLTVGAVATVRGASAMARRSGLPPFVLGVLTLGLEIGSLGTAVVAAGRGQDSIAAGTAVGTIVFMIAVAFGLTLLVRTDPVPAPSRTMVLLPAPALVLGAAALANEAVSRLQGAALVVAYVAYSAMVVREERLAVARGDEARPRAERAPGLPPVALSVAGLGLVVGGAALLVEGGVRLLGRTGLAAGFVGAAIVGGLASLARTPPAAPLHRNNPVLATGNLFVIIATFSTGVLGLAALVRPLAVDSSVSAAYLAACVLYTVVAVAFLARGRAGKQVGISLLLVYGVWLALASRL